MEGKEDGSGLTDDSIDGAMLNDGSIESDGKAEYDDGFDGLTEGSDDGNALGYEMHLLNCDVLVLTVVVLDGHLKHVLCPVDS
jgi:hypothetical protein